MEDWRSLLALWSLWIWKGFRGWGGSEGVHWMDSPHMEVCCHILEPSCIKKGTKSNPSQRGPFKLPRGTSTSWKDFSKEYRRHGDFHLILRKQMTLSLKSLSGSHSGNAILQKWLPFFFFNSLDYYHWWLLFDIKIWDSQPHTQIFIFFSHSIVLWQWWRWYQDGRERASCLVKRNGSCAKGIGLGAGLDHRGGS